MHIRFMTLISIFLLALSLPGIAVAADTEEEEPAPFVTPELEVPDPDPAVMGWVDSRSVTSLNGSWKLLVDPMKVGTPGGFSAGGRLPEHP